MVIQAVGKFKKKSLVMWTSVNWKRDFVYSKYGGIRLPDWNKRKSEAVSLLDGKLVKVSVTIKERK